MKCKQTKIFLRLEGHLLKGWHKQTGFLYVESCKRWKPSSLESRFGTPQSTQLLVY